MGFHYASTHTGAPRSRSARGPCIHFRPDRRRRERFKVKEKGSKEKELPVHHKLEELLDQYLKATGLEKEPESPLFPATIGLLESPSAVINASASLHGRRDRIDFRSLSAC